MKKIISFALFFVLVFATVAAIPVSAAKITLDPDRTPDTETYSYNDSADTNYKQGYVLHYMDFSKISSFGETDYFVAKNDSAPAAKAFELTDGALRIANDSSNKCFVLLTGNQIPKNIQNYSVDISFKFNNTDTSKGNYFGYVMSATLSSDGKYSNLIDQCIRWKTGKLDNCESSTDQNTLTAILTDMQAGKTVDFHYEALGRDCEKITVTCNGNIATYTRTQKSTAAAGSYMGFFVGKDDSVDIYTIRVTAGSPSQYDRLTWPSTANALVQTVTANAISDEAADEGDKLPTDRAVPTEPTISYEDKNTTYYNPGYVLHHMDFTKVNSFDETGYFVTNDAEPKKFTFTDEGYLNVKANNGSNVNILFTGNGIPKNIQDYTVSITFRYTEASTSYFNFIQSTTLDAETGKTSNAVETTVRYRLREKTNGYEPLIDQTSYIGEDAELTAFVEAMQAGKWVTLTYSAMERNTMTITLTGDGHTVSFIKEKNTEAAADSFMGISVGRGSDVEIHTVSVIAGYAGSYENLIWPVEENALVRSVAAGAIGTAPTKEPDSNNTSDNTNGKSEETTSTQDNNTADSVSDSDSDTTDKKGCKGSISTMSAGMILTAALACVTIKRRKKADR